MLTIYRRHSEDCQHSGKRETRAARGCACPIWVQGSLRGEYVRKALNLTSWEAASDVVVRGWHASGEIGVMKPDIPTVSEAVSRFFEDAIARGLKPATIGKYKVLLEKQLLPWCRGKGYTRCAAASCGGARPGASQRSPAGGFRPIRDLPLTRGTADVSYRPIVQPDQLNRKRQS